MQKRPLFKPATTAGKRRRQLLRYILTSFCSKTLRPNTVPRSLCCCVQLADGVPKCLLKLAPSDRLITCTCRHRPCTWRPAQAQPGHVPPDHTPPDGRGQGLRRGHGDGAPQLDRRCARHTYTIMKKPVISQRNRPSHGKGVPLSTTMLATAGCSTRCLPLTALAL